MKTGILGGSFDPIHNGHIIAAQDAMLAFGLDAVLFAPCNRPSHKRRLIASPLHRTAMLHAALKDMPAFRISDVDIRRGGITYSVDTVRDLAREQPGVEWHFIIGSDTLPDLHRWHEITTLLNLCRFDVIIRPGFEPAAMPEKSILLPDPWPGILLANAASGHLVDVSSSEIRRRVAGGMDIGAMVPPEVETYIAKQGLYRLL
jgi:nicotinate-nucleotide adenylyltransferase